MCKEDLALGYDQLSDYIVTHHPVGARYVLQDAKSATAAINITFYTDSACMLRNICQTG